jgi:peptidyl-prolyl cis-trans isomerase C
MKRAVTFSIISNFLLIAAISEANAQAKPAAAPKGPAPFAMVNGRPLTERDMRAALQGYTEGQKDSMLREEAVRAQVQTTVIERELFAQEAERRKIEDQPKFREDLADYRKQLLAVHLIQQVIEPKINDKEVRRFYDRNKVRFTTDQVCALHILKKTEQEAYKVLEAVKGKKDEVFKEVAKKESIDPSAANNFGDIGCFTRDRMAPEFSAVAFRLKKEETSNPVRTAFGYHIIRVIDVKPGKQLTFDDVKEQAKLGLRQEQLQAYLAELQTKYKVIRQ